MQSISILIYMMEFKADNGPHLIIVPKSTLSNWMNELQRWGPTLNAVKFHGSKEERLDIVTNVLQPGQRDELRKWNVCVTTYEICNLDRNVFNKFAWSYLVIDEAHRLKNEASIFSQTVRTLETRFRLLLTGTPLQNNLHELWALLNYLVPDVFASSEQFDEWFNLDIDDANEKNKLISQLHKILRPFMLRRLKADVEKSLPPKSETILFTGMSAMQKKLYKDILMRDLDTLTGKGGGSRTAVLNIVMQLRKCAGHPYLFPGVEDRSLDPLGEHLVENCGKMVLLDKLLIRLKERGHRVLLFTQMTRILDIMEDYMHMRGFQYCRIDGNTTYDDREERIDAYNKPESEKFLFLLSTRAGGLGINLQTADVVILYDSDWNPQADLQAQDRAHRIGQKRPVQVFRLVTEDTIEQKIVERAQQKLKLDAMVVQQGRLKDKDKLSADELLNAIRFGADKIFKSKDSSITDDDIELILDYGMKKTQELNEKFSSANKGDMLDFKLDGGLSAQTFEGIDYSEAKNAQFAEDFLIFIDVGKRERRTVAYNENQLYMQQMKQHATQPKKVVKKEIKLPRMLRLPKMEEWQLFDRDALYKLQELEEQAFRALPEELQILMGGTKTSKSNEEIRHPSDDAAAQGDTPKTDEGEPEQNFESVGIVKEEKDDQAKEITLESLPPLLREDQIEEKARLLAEGFADWSRHHFTAFVKASAKYGRSDYLKIANDVGKPVSAIKTYSEAFWDPNFGKKRFTEHEYDRVVKNIEKGEKKIEDIKGLQRGTKILISLFDNPWWELQFTHVNTKDKKFTSEEDRYLLCWAHKVGRNLVRVI
jgi:SWI/SNF-related matrix-associated actin-dependent regulator of chromatin subfamily A member 5